MLCRIEHFLPISRVLQDTFECEHYYSPPSICFSTKFSILTHNFQHITKNCQTQPSLRRDENHVEERKHNCDANTTFDSC